MLRKLTILGFAAIIALAIIGCGPKERATDETGEVIPTPDECETALTDYLNDLTAWKKDNMEVTNEELVAKFTEATDGLNAMSVTWTGYGDDYGDVAEMAAAGAAYYEATAGFVGLDQAKATPEEMDAVVAALDKAQPGWDELSIELGLD
ncbi:MAG: hypothetical protein GY771_10605 [bacterium]|nr:hypothetical protein [bacterium]